MASPTKAKRLLKNEDFQVAVAIAAILIALVGVYAAEVAGYVAVVPTGSMCIPYDGACDGWSHPFARTLHAGDILIVVPVNPKDLNTNYPNSDIIVYNTATYGRIVHRIAAPGPTTADGQLSFYTKGDGNGVDKWPNPISPSEYDPWSPVPANQIIGKVVLRIPWIGHITLFLQGLAGGQSSKIIVPVIIVLVVILILLEFVVPMVKKRGHPAESGENQQPNQQPQQAQPTP